MALIHLGPKANRKRIRDCARKAMKMIDDTLRSRKVEITNVSIAGEEETIQMDCGGSILTAMQTGCNTFTITIETYAPPMKKGIC